MLKRIFTIIFMMIFLFATPSAAFEKRGIKRLKELDHKSSSVGVYRALIIGIDDYRDAKIPDLKTAVKDAQGMADLLKTRYGFQVELMLDEQATRQNIYLALRKLSETAKPDESVLIYYAGHGDLDKVFNDGWWIPHDAEAGNPVTYLDNTQVQKAMRAIKSRHALLVSDSCYSGTLFGQARAVPPVITEKYYLNLYADKSRWGMTSGNREPVSDSGTGGHSVFAYQLLKALKRNDSPYLSTQELYTRIAPIIANNSEQTPLCRPIRNTGDQGGEFVFILADSGGMTTVKPKPEPKPEKKTTTLTIRADVPGAQVWLGETRCGEAPKSFEIQQSGNYRIRVTADGYKPYEKSESVKLGKDYEVKAYLEKETPVVVVKPEPKSSGPRETARDGRFVAYNDGTVLDTESGLMWAAEDNGENINWNDAKKYCENYRGGGYSDWRMPTQDELVGLYDGNASGYKLKCAGSDLKAYLTDLIHISCWCPWGSEVKSNGSAACFHFITGYRNWETPSYSGFLRALPVRVGK